MGIALAALTLLAPGCATQRIGARVPDHHGRASAGSYEGHHGHGPPPHAPAHGYRHKHHDHDVQLVFDSGLGVYLVVDIADLFFFDDHYYRWHDGHWLTSKRFDGRWTSLHQGKLPRGLRHYQGKAHKKKSGGRGHGPGSPR